MMFQTYFVYVGTVLLSCLFSFFATRSKTKYHRYFWVFSIILLLTLITGFRSTTVGRDSNGYATNYESQTLKWYEPGFTFLQKILFLINPNYTFFFTVVAFFTNFCIVWRLFDFNGKSNGASFVFCIFCFVATSFTVGFNGMRQWLAVAICFYATRYFFNDNKPKIIPYILLNAIGISIHYSAIAILILLIPVLLSKTKNRKLQVLRSLSVLAIIAGIFLGLYFFKERSYDKLLNPSKFEFGFMVIFKSLVIILIAFNFKLEKSDRNGELFLSKGLINYQYGWVILTECLYVALSSLSYGFEVLGRIAWYFELFETLFFANILSRRTNSLAVWASRFLIIVIIVTKFTGNFSVEEMRSPYLFFWQ